MGLPKLPFPDQLRTDREKAGYTQMSLATKLGLSYSAIQKWEAGKAVPDKTQRELLCEFFEWDGIYILVDSRNRTKASLLSLAERLMPSPSGGLALQLG